MVKKYQYRIAYYSSYFWIERKQIRRWLDFLFVDSCWETIFINHDSRIKMFHTQKQAQVVLNDIIKNPVPPRKEIVDGGAKVVKKTSIVDKIVEQAGM
jgi:hypothetical protein